MRFIEKKFVEVIFPGRITTLARSNRTGHHERMMKDVRYDDVICVVGIFVVRNRLQPCRNYFDDSRNTKLIIGLLSPKPLLTKRVDIYSTTWYLVRVNCNKFSVLVFFASWSCTCSCQWISVTSNLVFLY